MPAYFRCGHSAGQADLGEPHLYLWRRPDQQPSDSQEAGIDLQRRAKEMTEEELAKIIGIIDRDFLVEGALRRAIQQNIARLRDIGATAATGIAGRFRCAASARGATPAPARVRARRWPVRRA